MQIDMKNSDITFPIAIICSRFNESITQGLLAGALDRLTERGFLQEQITVIHVPGAVEIPYIARKLAKQGKFSAIITLGAVIRGETTHYDYVCQIVSDGVARVAYEYELPVIFGVLTTENEEQAYARIGGVHGHKGRDAIDAAVEMVSLTKILN